MDPSQKKVSILKRKLLQMRIAFFQYLLTHFKVLWYIFLNTPGLKKYSRRFLYNLVGSGAVYPFPYTTKHPYVTVDGIEDYSYYARMLPEKPRAADYKYPPVDELVKDIFLRRHKSDSSQHTDRNSSLLFGGFAQWFAAGFLLTDPTHHGRSGLYPTSTANVNTVYGNDEKTRRVLRSMSGGKLKSQKINGQEYPMYIKDLPEIKESPLMSAFLQRTATHAAINNTDRGVIDSETLFAFGQIQINSTPGAMVWGIVFLREHNQICDELQKIYPDWDDERLYQTARNICTLILNKIVVVDYIGRHNGHHLAMDIPFSPEVLTGPQWSFGSVTRVPIEWNHLYRFHSFVPDTMKFNSKEMPIASVLYRPDFVVQHGLDAVVDQLSRYPICPFGPQNTPFFLLPAEKNTIEAGRQANLATYNDYRERMGLLRALSFEEINPDPSVVEALHKHYKSVDDVEFYVGLIAEKVQKDRLFPMLLQRMLSCVAFKIILLQPWLAPSVWKRRDEMLMPFGSKRLDETSIQSLFYRHVANETYVSFFLPR
ncbi:MAG: peroxidase family protein [Gammaproteobacteria bacterium]